MTHQLPLPRFSDDLPLPSVLIAYSTIDGHTLTIGRRIQTILEHHGHRVTLIPVEEALRMDCCGFDKIILGASIRYGWHRPSVYDFIAHNRELLRQTPSAFFSVSAVARKEGKNTPATNPYFKKFVRRSQWVPSVAATFGGQIDYARYTFTDRWMIRLIMWLTRGPTDLKSAVEFTDWSAVEGFAMHISRLGNQA